MEDVMPPYGDDYQLPDAEPFPKIRRAQADEQNAEYEGHETISESFESNTAPNARKKRTRKPLEHDRNTELRSTELISWNVNYLTNMEDARKRKLQGKSALQAKKNAEWFLWGVGLGGIGAELGHLKIPNELEGLYGDRLKNLMLGRVVAPQMPEEEGADEDDDEDGQRKRMRRAASDEIGRGQDVPGEDQAGMDVLYLAGEEVSGALLK